MNPLSLTGQSFGISGPSMTAPLTSTSLQEDLAANFQKDTTNVEQAGMLVTGGVDVSKTALKGKNLLQLLMMVLKANNDKDTELLQVWMPSKAPGGYRLDCKKMPFILSSTLDDNLTNFRQASTKYTFHVSTDGSSTNLGLPGRVFLSARPELSPDVRLYSKKEYLRLNEAIDNGITSSVALPVLCGKEVVAIVETVSVDPMNFARRIGKICDSLSQSGLSSVNITHQPICKTISMQHVAATSSIMNQAVIKLVHLLQWDVSGMYTQVWIPTVVQYRDNLSAVQLVCSSRPSVDQDHPFYQFQTICTEVTLFPGEGPAGQAYTQNNLIAASDIRMFSARDYGLVKFARIHNVQLMVGVKVTLDRQHSCVLEFMFDNKSSISAQDRIAVLCRSLYMHCPSCNLDAHIGRPTWFSGIKAWDPDVNLGLLPAPNGDPSTSMSMERCLSGSTLSAYNDFMTDGIGAKMPSVLAPPSQILPKIFDITQSVDQIGRQAGGGGLTAALPGGSSGRPGGGGAVGEVDSDGSDVDEDDGDGKDLDGKHSSNKKTVSLQLLQKYFHWRLKDAAAEIGVCPTTLKRICRQHGIMRWPCRKLKKVNRTFQQLQGAIGTVESNVLKSSKTAELGDGPQANWGSILSTTNGAEDPIG
mmetsp:Transcript_28762/g.34945  ORF Transcript_28762/g.34945 Transcript_28762/m.34945 type:complete len:643 (-) Transcript_28762:1331-3259(-)